MENAVHRIKACTGPNSVLSIEIATWRITRAATKATGTVLTETDEVLSLETLLKKLQQEIKTFSSQRSPCWWIALQVSRVSFVDSTSSLPCKPMCVNLAIGASRTRTRLGFTRSKIVATRIVSLMETREVKSRRSKRKVIGLLYALRPPTFKP